MNWFGPFGLTRKRAHIAPASFAHCESLAAIHADAFARPWGADEFEAFLADRAIRIDCLLFGRDPDPSGFVILSLALARAARGRGCSSLLLDHHLVALRDAGTARVHLEVEEGNAPAIALYERAGFVRSGRRPGYYTRPDGTRISALSMTLVLADPPGGERA